MRLTDTLLFAALAVPDLALAQATAGSSEPAADEDRGREGIQIVGHVIKPVPLEWSEERMSRLALPDGFDIDVFARGLENPRMIRVADDGTVYVTRRENGDVLMLRDSDGDGAADEREVVAEREEMHGIEIDGDAVYLMTVNEVFRTERHEDGTFGEFETIADGFPVGG